MRNRLPLEAWAATARHRQMRALLSNSHDSLALVLERRADGTRHSMVHHLQREVIERSAIGWRNAVANELRIMRSLMQRAHHT
jgi:hypothetical protein